MFFFPFSPSFSFKFLNFFYPNLTQRKYFFFFVDFTPRLFFVKLQTLKNRNIQKRKSFVPLTQTTLQMSSIWIFSIYCLEFLFSSKRKLWMTIGRFTVSNWWVQIVGSHVSNDRSKWLVHMCCQKIKKTRDRNCVDKCL